LVDGRELASIRHPVGELLSEARENGGRRDHRDLLSDDLEDQSAEQVHCRQPPHPDVGVEIRMVVDHLGKHRISRMQPGQPSTNLLRPRCHDTLQLRSSRPGTGRPTACFTSPLARERN
jgi:hypothetical protein